MLYDVKIIKTTRIDGISADTASIATHKAQVLALNKAADTTKAIVIDVHGYEVNDRFLGPNGTVIVTALTKDLVSYRENSPTSEEQIVPRRLFEEQICCGILHSHRKETETEKAMRLINDYCISEFESPANFEDLAWIGIGHTTAEDNNLPIQVYADLQHFAILRYINGIKIETRQYSSLTDLISQELECLSFDDLVYFTEEQFALAASGNAECANALIGNMTMDTSGLVVSNLPGTWHVADHIVLDGQIFWWMTNDVEPNETPIIVDSDGLLCIRDARNGFDARNVRLLKLESLPVPVMPDETINKREMKAYGYYFGGMLPLRKDTAQELYSQNCAIYRLYDDDTEGMIEAPEEFEDHAMHSGIFGIEKEDWLNAIKKIIVKRSEPNYGKEKAHPA